MLGLGASFRDSIEEMSSVAVEGATNSSKKQKKMLCF